MNRSLLERREPSMYIGIGTIVVILLVVIVFMLMRRSRV